MVSISQTTFLRASGSAMNFCCSKSLSSSGRECRWYQRPPLVTNNWPKLSMGSSKSVAAPDDESRELPDNLRVLARQLDVRGTLELDLAPVNFAFVLLVRGQQLFGMGEAFGHVGAVADEVRPHLRGHGPEAQ